MIPSHPNHPDLPPSDPALYAAHQLAAIAARWDARAAGWDRDLQDPACHLNEDEAYPRFLREAESVIASRRDFCARHGLIDFACGTGLVLAHLLPAFAFGVGLDLSPEMIRRAAAKQLPRACFLVGDCFHPPFAAPAGAVVSRGVLLSHYGPEHAPRLLAAARGLLVPGGFALFDFLNPAARAAARHAPDNKAYFHPAEAIALARRAGFADPLVIGEPARRVLLLLATRS